MKLRLTKVDEYQFLICLKHGIWGSKLARFKDWKRGDLLGIIVNKAIAAIGEVNGDPFVAEDPIWTNGVYPHRIQIDFFHALLPNNRPPILGVIRDTLTALWGTKYGFGILNQYPIEGESIQRILDCITSKPNNREEMLTTIDQLLSEASIQVLQEQERAKQTQKRKKPTPHTPPPSGEDIENLDHQEETLHTQAQSELIGLGKVTGCAVWVASNDYSKTYQGKSFRDSCLQTLPNMGLSAEATKRISMIDVIWIKQNAPVCAFEVEATTSIYSGLLRMSDLLAVIPAINIRLYIVAPQTRQERVLRELARPTFQKIGLNDFCKYISTEHLFELTQKVKGFGGHIQPTILDTIAIGLEDENEA